MDKNNTSNNKVSPIQFLNNDKKVDSINLLENDHFILNIEEKLNDGELILNDIKFKRIEYNKKDPIFLQNQN